jgi:hypothetical protein
MFSFSRERKLKKVSKESKKVNSLVVQIFSSLRTEDGGLRQ